jgi:hypothetical protein
MFCSNTLHVKERKEDSCENKILDLTGYNFKFGLKWLAPKTIKGDKNDYYEINLRNNYSR